MEGIMNTEQLSAAKKLEKDIDALQKKLADVKATRLRVEGKYFYQGEERQKECIDFLIRTRGDWEKSVSLPLKHKEKIAMLLRMIEAEVSAEIEGLEKEFAEL